MFLFVMVLVGALVISNYYFQRIPVIQDVNAKVGYSNNIGSYVSNGSYGMGSIGSYGCPYSPGSTSIFCPGAGTYTF
ncbi:MAG: hypothetical protein ACMUIM_10135 [bacterium]